MDNEFLKLDVEEMRNLLVKHQADLEKALIDGASWKEVQKQRKLITELSILIDKRSSADPAEREVR
jgi:hypothetical protein